MSGAAAGIDGTKIGGTLFFGTLSGGFGAVLTNGNFWQGAATGLIVSGLNHVAHKMGDGDGKGKTLKDLKESPPDHPEYEPPKGGARKVKNPN